MPFDGFSEMASLTSCDAYLSVLYLYIFIISFSLHLALTQQSAITLSDLDRNYCCRWGQSVGREHGFDHDVSSPVSSPDSDSSDPEVW